MCRKAILLVTLGMFACWIPASADDPSHAADDPSHATDPLVQEIETWLNQNAAELPNNLSDFVETPALYRRAVFKVLPPATQSKLWLEHLEQWTSGRRGLSTAQQKLLHKIARLMSDERIFSTAPNSPRWHEDVAVPVEKVRQEAVHLFGHNHATSLLENLGGQLVAPNVVIRDSHGGISVRSGCGCSLSSDWCGSDCFCVPDGCSTSGGCGTLLLFQCNGSCYHDAGISQE